MDAAILGDRLPEGIQKPVLGPGSLSLRCRHGESSKVLAGLAFCEMLSQYPWSAFRGFAGVQRGQQQFATQTLRVHLLGIDPLNSTPLFRHPDFPNMKCHGITYENPRELDFRVCYAAECLGSQVPERAVFQVMNFGNM